MEAIELTAVKAIALMEEIVAEAGGDFIYPRAASHRKCVYVENGEPSCLVGKVLHKAGVPLERLKQADETFGGISAGVLVENLRDEGVLTCDDAYGVLADAQYEQDHANTWGAALGAAKQYI